MEKTFGQSFSFWIHAQFFLGASIASNSMEAYMQMPDWDERPLATRVRREEKVAIFFFGPISTCRSTFADVANGMKTAIAERSFDAFRPVNEIPLFWTTTDNNITFIRHFCYLTHLICLFLAT
jgi:hypothetical protein